MAILIGIDEAGYGPILGPLVVSAAIFELPEQMLSSSMWDILRKSVCKQRSGSLGRVVVNDSKKLHNKHGDYRALQRGVFAFLATAGEPPQIQTLHQLLELLALPQAQTINDLAEYPWYKNAANRPLNNDDDDIETASHALSHDMIANNIEFRRIWSCPLAAGHFNRLVDVVKNKADVSFSLVCQIIYQAYRIYGSDNLQIVIDKQSGRQHYRKPLQKMFPEMQLKIITEDPYLSSYQLSDSNSSTSLKIHFLQKGEQRQLPIALASMTSKYLRELFMEMLNAYFRQHCPEITPTAGYYQDGRRFLNDLDTHQFPSHLAPQHLLVRQR